VVNYFPMTATNTNLFNEQIKRRLISAIVRYRSVGEFLSSCLYKKVKKKIDGRGCSTHGIVENAYR
jgi:hypothetical protein